MSDEGFREIQLNGKQLVFLFMAATVVSVVIFLCGVLVGRGVRGNGGVAEMASANVGPDPGAMPMPDSTTPPASQPASAATPPVAGEAVPPAPPAEELSYADRLLREDAPRENLKETRPAPATAPKATQKAPPPTPPPTPSAAEPTAPKTAAVTSPPSNPSGPGYAVQVAAYRDRREADMLAKQLIAKGYPAFVMDPVKGAPTAMFRVRVGKYKTLKDAEAVSVRLQTAEQFKPWIAR